MVARFIAGMMMHLNTEKDVRNGLMMMKFAVNHYRDFTNIHCAFLISFLLAFTSLTVEFTCLCVLATVNNILTVIMKYAALGCIVNLPRFYFA